METCLKHPSQEKDMHKYFSSKQCKANCRNRMGLGSLWEMALMNAICFH